jgi:2',3'-cyclic-nucleotide 2'-phosphodiesterase (5'-nucleotidase family)
VLAHAGAACAEAGCQAEAQELASELQDDGVDLVVAGQGDAGVTRRVGRVWLVQARAAGAELGIVDLVRTPVGARELRARREPVDAEALPPDPEMAALVDRYRGLADSIALQPVARVRLPLRRGSGGDSPLGTLLADAIRNAARVDAALADGGSLAADLPAGVATYAVLSAALPRPEPIVRGTVSGAALRALLEESLGESGPTLHLAGLTVRWDRGARPGKRLRELKLIDGRPFRAGASYTIALTQALAASGRLAGLARLRLEPAAMRDRDALAVYLRRLPQPVAPPAPPRFEESRR